jgi:hypothetical protein
MPKNAHESDSRIQGKRRPKYKAWGISFERPLSEKEAEFWQDVVKTALENYVQARLQNRVDRLPSETPEETHGPPSGLQSKVTDDR